MTDINAIYDRSTAPIWRHLVYDPVHGGREFANIGGRRLLDFIGEVGCLDNRAIAAEIGSGLGATCAYLADRFGCRVYGVDINPNQIFEARARMLTLSSQLAQKIIFVDTDFMAWRPGFSCNVVYSADSLVLIPAVREVIAKARSILTPTGCLVLGEVTAGPHITDSVRKWVLETDGFCTLLEPDAYKELLATNDLRVETLEDWTEDGSRVFRTIRQCANELASNKIDLSTKLIPLSDVEEWHSLASEYENLFQTRKLTYHCIVARVAS